MMQKTKKQKNKGKMMSFLFRPGAQPREGNHPQPFHRCLHLKQGAESRIVCCFGREFVWSNGRSPALTIRPVRVRGIQKRHGAKETVRERVINVKNPAGKASGMPPEDVFPDLSRQTSILFPRSEPSWGQYCRSAASSRTTMTSADGDHRRRSSR